MNVRFHLDERLRRCVGCGRVYWPGTHHERLARLVARAVPPCADPDRRAPGA